MVAVVNILIINFDFIILHTWLKTLLRLDNRVVLARIRRNNMLGCDSVNNRAKFFKVNRWIDWAVVDFQFVLEWLEQHISIHEIWIGQYK